MCHAHGKNYLPFAAFGTSWSIHHAHTDAAVINYSCASGASTEAESHAQQQRKLQRTAFTPDLLTAALTDCLMRPRQGHLALEAAQTDHLVPVRHWFAQTRGQAVDMQSCPLHGNGHLAFRASMPASQLKK